MLLVSSDIEVARHNSAAALHQALHHPSIVSLFSSFSNSRGLYHVLELCRMGSLSEFLQSRHPPILSEDELRGVLKNIVDALIYLRSEHILHRGITTSNIQLSEGCRAKLAGFDHAIRLNAGTTTGWTHSGSSNHLAPEIVAGEPYGFSADVWSLGCLMVTCLSGFPAFEGSDDRDTTNNIARSRYILPDTISFEAEDLTAGLLQMDPADRIPLHRILHHPFFNPALPVKALSPPQTTHQASSKSTAMKENQAIPQQDKAKRYPRSLFKGAPSSKRPAVDSTVGRTSSMPSFTRKPLENTTNQDIRGMLSNELSNPVVSRSDANDERYRRIMSAPSSGRANTPRFRKPNAVVRFPNLDSTPTTPDLTSCSDSPPPAVFTTYERHSDEQGARKYNDEATVHPLFAAPNSRISLFPTRGRSKSVSSPVSSPHQEMDKQSAQQTKHTTLGVPARSRSQSIDKPRPHSPPTAAVALGCTRPIAFTTAYLAPQTHKVAQGQIVVLPSASLLVDLREGQRRKGEKGNEVLVICPNGRKVQVFSAPHLSTPCCLAEPLATYSLDDLPTVYWKSYDDAGRIVNHLKQRIPKLILYKPDFKCTLMANEPCGDIELLFSAARSDGQMKQGGEGVSPAGSSRMRIRLWRRRNSVEVSSFIPAAQPSQAGTGEWIKKVLPATEEGVLIPGQSLDALNLQEKTGVKRLTEFLLVCTAVESLGLEDRTFLPSPAPLSEHDHDKAVVRVPDDRELDGRRRMGAVLSRIEKQTGLPHATSVDRSDTGKLGSEDTLATVATTASLKVLPSFTLPPRPSKFSPVLRPRSGEVHLAAVSGFASGRVARGLGLRETLDDDSDIVAHQGVISTGSVMEDPNIPETRFIASTGWCVRSLRGGAECYRIMFHDGASLEVEMGSSGEEAVQFTNSAKEPPMRMSRADAENRIHARMEAFDEFVVLFSDA
ncbi:uncharacterized protein LAESUDRAFT_691279 [Laetiporus sulphureus 93-53]|uniref:Uncharacterized protein n=1 Tax=Laetiporus sulphureus 93-53 TaxID=1314785 RepID=A0A165HS54_9APHY|nr:uncharacterized protein LAESUDRAFT_691279 [Laetiporus sulphureus 93-53]KZT12112.1 hypothetical protein LAESUDRAFT_691279 [Laetiporus sulphureus 93-53]